MNVLYNPPEDTGLQSIFISGRYYSNHMISNGISNSAIVANTLHAWPLFLTKPISIDRLALMVNATGTATAARIGIYSNNPANNYPDALIIESGQMDVSTTGLKQATVSATLQPGLYWLAYLANGTATMSGPNTGLQPYPMGSSGLLNFGGYYTVALAYAALPATFTGSATVGVSQYTSVPFFRVV